MSQIENSKLTTEYRDKLNIKRNELLNEYAQNTQERGDMYYIYDKNSQNENAFNLCICKEEQSHIVIEKGQEELPEGAKIGTVLRKKEDEFVIDIEGTHYISNEINKLNNQLLQEQTEFLDSVRIENHVYELCEKQNDRAWLFDITSNSNEAIEEIEFPEELLKEAQEGDLFVFRNNEYIKNKSTIEENE